MQVVHVNKITLNIPLTLPTLNVWQRWQWFKRRDYERELAKHIAHHPIKEPFQKAHIAVTRTAPGPLPDPDNLILKPLLDVLQINSKRHPHGVGIIADDTRDHVVISPVVAKSGKGFTRVVITEIDHA